MIKKTIRFIFYLALLVGLLSSIAGLLVGFFFYFRFTRDLPQIQQISDYRPKAVTTVYADDGSKIAELFDERRYPVTFEEIPPKVRQAFLAAEDANFYNHAGIDLVSIARAAWINFTSKATRQGASTITQQIVKSLLLTREKTYERKAKEAILSYRLEKALTKDEILTIYLNEIFLGSGAYGVKAAARVHFRKELEELSIAEIAYLGGLPQRPSELANPKNRKIALRRQGYVLKQMLRNQFITKQEYDEAKQTEIEIYPPLRKTIFGVPYFAGHVIRILDEVFKNEIEGNFSPTDPGGYEIATTVSPQAYDMARRALQKNLRDLDKRRGWRGVLFKKKNRKEEPSYSDWEELQSVVDLETDRVYPALITKLNKKNGIATVSVGPVTGVVPVRKATWAKKYLNDGRTAEVSPERMIRSGDVIEVSLDNSKKTNEKDNVAVFKFDQTPKVQGAMTVSNALTGEVKAIIGGYDYQKSQFNRATQGLLQPGSAFKPFIYLAAVEELGYTPATIVPDSPISMTGGDGKLWAPQNYDRTFLGPITLRTALQRSRNVVSVYLLKRVGVQRGIESAQKLGISTPIAPNMSISLGTPEVHQIDLVRAYGTFAAEGWLADRIIIKSIKDRNGEMVYQKQTKQEKVVADEDAFIMANMMKGVVERGTAQRVKKLGRPVAGKTGTTNDQMDAWFVGYTPEWVAGVWVGFDVKQTLGKHETGGKAAAPAFLYFMEEFLEGTPILDFNIPDGVIPVAINLQSGHLVNPESSDAFIEYFKSGTEPRNSRQEIEIPKDYLTNDEF